MIQIVIADDHLQVIAGGLEKLLQKADDIEIVGGARNKEEVAVLLKEDAAVDLVLLDLGFPRSKDGLDCLKQICRHHPKVKVIMYSMHIIPRLIQKTMEWGASGYLTKSDTPQEMIQGIRAVMRGERYLSHVIGEELTRELIGSGNGNGTPPADADESTIQFTERQLDIIKLIAMDHSSKEIAEILGIVLDTVSQHRKVIKGKAKKELGISTMIGLIVWLIQHGFLMDLDDWEDPGLDLDEDDVD